MSHNHYDVVLVWAGVMSATLAALLHELQPSLKIGVFERLWEIAKESSDAMNNAWTWHSAFCELNYTPQKSDWSIDISKAIGIAESFELSKQFWAYLAGKWYISSPQVFINTMPHCSVVFGKEDVQFLKSRYVAMQTSSLFQGMQYTEDPSLIASWMPLITQWRPSDQPIAATYMDIWTDIDFGALTRSIFAYLQTTWAVEVALHHDIRSIKKLPDGWREIHIANVKNNTKRVVTTPFVFIGAGWRALPLLQQSGIKKARQFGWFPVSGQWLVCENPDVIAQHEAKVYGKAALWAPPMSVPHLDTRIINGKKKLLFGPYAGFTTKFLKKWSFLDLPLSVHWYNIKAMLGAWIHNIPLTKYLIQQVSQSSQARLEALKEYYPEAKAEDWQLMEAWYRVQIIKADAKKWGVLQFGTEVVVAEDTSLATLLGASPWASTAVDIMLRIVEQCFPQYTKDAIKTLIPTYWESLHANPSLLTEMRQKINAVLWL